MLYGFVSIEPVSTSRGPTLKTRDLHVRQVSLVHTTAHALSRVHAHVACICTCDTVVDTGDAVPTPRRQRFVSCCFMGSVRVVRCCSAVVMFAGRVEGGVVMSLAI